MSGGWRVGGASITGASHLRAGRGNQDALAVLSSGQSAATRVTAAVCDGHGAPAHFRSATGSRIAADGATRLLAWQIDDVGTTGGDDAVVPEIVGYWRKGVLDDVEARPFTPDEPVSLWGDMLTPYGTTLVAFAADADRIVALQIGDGDLLLGYADGRVERPLRADTGLVGEETYSLCLPDAEARFRVASIVRGGPVEWPDFICVVTDGVAKSYRDDPSFLSAIRELRRNAGSDWETVIAALPGWLNELSQFGSGDDATIALACRTNFQGNR